MTIGNFLKLVDGKKLRQRGCFTEGIGVIGLSVYLQGP